MEWSRKMKPREFEQLPNAAASQTQPTLAMPAKARRIRCLLLLFHFIVVLLVPGRVMLRAEVLHFAFSGFVVAADSYGFVLDGSITEGTPLIGFYRFESTTPDSNADPTVGDYYHTDFPAEMTVKLGNYVFRTDPQQRNVLIEIVNRPGDDDYQVSSQNTICSPPLPVYALSWQLIDPAGTHWTNDALPTVPPDLQRFFHNDLSVFGYSDVSNYYFLGTVTNIVAVPEAIPNKPRLTLTGDQLFWPSVLGFFYQVQVSYDLINWQNTGANLFGNGQAISTTLSLTNTTNAYFRTRIINQP